ncbi:MAG: excinuclease ABC subunit UvrA [Bacilli bacterium]
METDSKKYIIVKGARENNLKNLSFSIPKNSLVVFSGLSGSGKSTLAFDTIYVEGQRRYVESLSSYARQFLGNIEKPDVDSIEGLSPAIAIEQKTTSHNPRSTVGTVTEIYDYLRLLFGRIGVPYCPIHNEPIIAFSRSKMVDMVLAYPLGTHIQILSPIVIREKGTQKEVLLRLKNDGFSRIRLDGEFTTVEEVKDLDKNKKHNIDIVVDRIVLKEDSRSRIFDAIELATNESKGYALIYTSEGEQLLSEHNACPKCGFSIPKLEPRLFSFNAPLGCCPDCNGLGVKQEADIDLIMPDKSLSIAEGGIKYYKNTVLTTNLDWQDFAKLLEIYSIDISKPLKNMSPYELDIILNGSKEAIKYSLRSSSGNVLNRFGKIEGIKTRIERLYNDTTSEFSREWYQSFIRDVPCTKCGGARLSPEALSVKIDSLNIYEVTCLSLDKLYQWICALPSKLSKNDAIIGDLVIKEIKNRVKFLCDVGLDYLTLNRTAQTLSGGESQRIRLATQIGSRLSGVLYVLDEPSIGLHQKDNDKLIATMKEMVDLGNTLIVVEHDEDTIKAADYILDIGPGAGIHGGEIVGEGSLEDIMNSPRSITGDYLAGRKEIFLPKTRRKINKSNMLTLKGCSVNNLKSVDVSIPLGMFTCVTGVSGSGKSSLINETVYKAVQKYLTGEETHPGKYESIEGLENIDKVVNITQDPIGRTPRSNPATYVKAFDEIRELYAETKEAKARGYGKGRFSFNVPGGRCEHCEGAGVSRISMNFLPDVYITCDECNGKRYNEETLQCLYKGKSISDVLDMTIEDAMNFFANRSSIYRRLKSLYDVGLGYVKVGQPATTLSGGEAQRVKLANELQRKPTGKTLYILDEPTTGLHSDDVAKLINVLFRIVNNGDSVLIIEHNMDIIKVADYIIDIGPDGGYRGGEIIATGTPEEIAKCNKSYTGQYLKKYLRKEKGE